MAKAPAKPMRLVGSQRRIIEKLRAERIRQGISIQELADRTGLHYNALSRLESNEDVNPTSKTLEKIADALNLEFEIRFKAQKSKVVTVYNAAGGSGKTTFVREVGAIMAHRGYNVLLMDMDPQGTLTYSLGINVDTVPVSDTVIPALWAMQANQPTPEIIPKEIFGMHLIPSTGMLSSLDPTLREARQFTLLERFVDSFRERYDLVLIDPTPFPGGLVGASIRASDAVVVPISGEVKSTWGYNEANKFIADLSSNKPALHVAMFVPSQIDTTAHAQEVEAWARQNLTTYAPVSSTLRARRGLYKDSIASETPIVHFATPSERRDALEDLNRVTDEFVSLMGMSTNGS